MHADDTSLTVAHSDVYILEQQMNHELHENHTRIIANKLRLNVIETKYMIVATQYRIKHLDYLEHQFNIHVDCKPLGRDETYKYLGVELTRPIIN